MNGEKEEKLAWKDENILKKLLNTRLLSVVKAPTLKKAEGRPEKRKRDLWKKEANLIFCFLGAIVNFWFHLSSVKGWRIEGKGEREKEKGEEKTFFSSFKFFPVVALKKWDTPLSSSTPPDTAEHEKGRKAGNPPFSPDYDDSGQCCFRDRHPLNGIQDSAMCKSERMAFSKAPLYHASFNFDMAV